LRVQIDQSGDAALAALRDELAAYPCPASAGRHVPAGIVVPLRLRGEGGGILSFLSTTTVFGTAIEVTLSELTLEAFYPADEETRAALLAGATRER